MFPLNVSCNFYFTVHRKLLSDAAVVSQGNTYALNGSTLYVDNVLRPYVPENAVQVNPIQVNRGDAGLVAIAPPHE